LRIFKTAIRQTLDSVSWKQLERNVLQRYLFQGPGLIEIVVIRQVKVTSRGRRKLALGVKSAQLGEAIADRVPGLEEFVAERCAEGFTDLIADVDLDVVELDGTNILVRDVDA
jgi:hypothetical protein